MAERRAGPRGRRMGSNRRKQLREGPSEAPSAAPGPGEEPPGASGTVQRVQDFFKEQDKDQAGFVTRSDTKKLQEYFPCSTEELELVFEGLDSAGTGQWRTEDFTAGLWQAISSQKAAREHRRRKTASRRVRLVLPSPVEEGADSEEQRHFANFMEQLGTDNISEEKEIWQLWVKLRRDNPHLLGNLEEFLAKMRHHIQEARSKKAALEVTLNKRVAEHDKEVQQLCEAMEQQIEQEKQRLEQESEARRHQHKKELQWALDASEREVQRLVRAQVELETRCHSLRSTQQATSTENQQLEESNQELETRLQQLHQQLQQTHGRLRSARAAVAWEHREEPRARAVAELPNETPVSPQTSPMKSEKHRSEMWIRPGARSSEPRAKSTHQVVWEMPPAEIGHLGALRRASSTEDPFPELLKEESSLLREMNDAIAALSKQLKPQAPGAPPVPADGSAHPQDDAEPQAGLEAATAFGTTTEDLQETLLGHISHKVFGGDLKEGAVTAQPGAPDVTQPGASAGAGAQQLGAEQGESPEEAWRTLFLQGKGTGVKELVLKAAEHPEGAPGERVEAGELMEMEGVGEMQEKTSWEKARLLGEAEEVALRQGENPEAGLGSPEAGETCLAAGWQLGPALEECAQPRSTGLGEEAEETSGCSEELERKPGEQLEREAPSWGQVWMGAAQGDGALPEVTVDPDPGMLEEECVRVEVQPWGETLDAKVPPAQQEERGRAGAEEGEVEVTQPLEAEPQGESAMGDAAWGENVGAEGLLPVAVPPTDVQGGGTGTDVQQLEAQSGDANVQLLAEADVAQQPWSEPGCPGTEQGGKVVPGVQPLEEVNKAELGLGEEPGAAAVQGEGPSPTERPAGGAGRSGLLPVKAQALEQMGTEESRTHKQLREDPSPEAPQGGGGHAALQLGDEGEDEGRGQGEHELPNEPLVELNGAEFGQGLGTGAEEQPRSETDEFSTGRKDPAPLPVVLFRGQRPGVEEGGDVHHPEEELELVQGEGIDKDGLFLVKAQALEVVEAEDSWGDAQLPGGVSPETPQGGEGPASTELRGETEDGAQRQGEWELPCELHPQGAGVGQGEGAGVQPWEEAVIPDTLEDQSSDANMQLLAEAVELELTPGGSMEEDVQPLSEAGYLGREQGWSVAPEVQLVDQGDKPELVELVEAEDLHVDTQLCEGLRPETLQGEERGVALELMEEAEDGAQGQDKRGLPQEPGLHPHGVAIGPGEGAPEGLQPREEAESLDTLEDQSTDAKVQLLAEVAELKVTPGWGAEADLQPLGETGSLDTEQAGHVAPDVQLQGQVHKPETVKLVEAEDSWVDTHLHGAASPEILHGWGDHAAVHLMEEAGGQEQGQGECELPQEPVFDPQGAGARQREGAGARVQSQEEAGILDTPEDPSSDADMQPLSEVYEPETAPGGGTKADLGTLGEADFMNTEQGGAVAPDVQPLDQINEPELVEMEADNSWVDTQPCGGLSQETPQAAEGPAALELVEEAEDGVQGQGEHELPQEPVLGLQGTRAWQGDGAGAGVQPWEEAGILERLEDKRPDRTTQPLTEVEELTSTLGGSTEADLAILDAAGLQEGDQSQAPGPEAGLCAAPTTDTLEGAAGARVTSPAEATSYPECAVAPQGPGFEAKLGALTGPDGHILGDTQTQELQLEERAAADRRPLDGAPSLEVVQGEKPEAGMKTLWGTRGLGLKQGHDAAASALAPLVPEVPLQTSTLKLETMMQEDVLVPDVRRPGPSGQAAQSELQEQGSAQADKVRVGIASQQPEEKPPHVMETEQVPARPAEPPKQEVPPASTLHPEVQWEEGAGNDQLGMVLGDSSLWDAANSSIQLQRQLLGEQSKDLSAAQQEKKQEVGRKTSQNGEPSPGAASADGAGAAPRGSPEASLEPDHLYNVLFVGDSHVGKTSFLYRLHVDTFNPHLTATVGLDYQIKNLVVDNERFALRLWDSAGQERYHSITKQFFRKADGVVLMYDITSEYSFADVRYWLSCIQEGAEDGVVILLLGNKTDCAAERQVPTKEGERLAKEHQLMFYECSAASGHNVSESMVSLIRLLKVHEDELKKKAEEAPKPSQKKKGCCW